VATETKETGVNVQSWLPPDLAQQVRAKAEAEKRSISQVVRLALEDQLARRPG
jgi:Ribbon-helix-helix protein, copG family